MKRIFILMCVLLMSNVAFAKETTTQEIKNNQSYATLNIQKQPATAQTKQKIDNHFTFFTINVQVNGKVEYPVKEQ